MSGGEGSIGASTWLSGLQWPSTYHVRGLLLTTDFKKDGAWEKVGTRLHGSRNGWVNFSSLTKSPGLETFPEVAVPIRKFYFKISHCLEREGRRWVRTKKGGCVYWTPSIFWILMLSFHFHSYRKQLLLVPCSKGKRSEGLCRLQADQSTNRNENCLIQNIAHFTVTVGRGKTKHMKGKS